jgi:Icc-related predicted phosphoesterase
MKICIISDTHNLHKFLKLPEADCIIHCGDFTSLGKPTEIINFMSWFANLNQYKYKICIAGNHDWLFETDKEKVKSLIYSNIIYLEDSGVTIEGINFYGTPVQKMFCNWAFNRPDENLKLYWDKIPTNTDVLITHSPPYGILDYVPKYLHQGSESLYDKVCEIKPKLHCFGHIHESYGIHKEDNITFVNASIVNELYIPINEPIIIEI